MKMVKIQLQQNLTFPSGSTLSNIITHHGLHTPLIKLFSQWYTHRLLFCQAQITWYLYVTSWVERINIYSFTFHKEDNLLKLSPKILDVCKPKKVTQKGLVKLVFQYSCSSIETLIWVWNQATPNVINPWINTTQCMISNIHITCTSIACWVLTAIILVQSITLIHTLRATAAHGVISVGKLEVNVLVPTSYTTWGLQ